MFSTLCENLVGSLTPSANQCREDAGKGDYVLPSLSKKTRMSYYFVDVIAKATHSSQLF